MVCFHLGTNYIVVSNDWSRWQSTMIKIYPGSSRNLSADVYCFVKSSFQIDSASAQWLFNVGIFSVFSANVQKESNWQKHGVLCPFTRHKTYFRSEPTLQAPWYLALQNQQCAWISIFSGIFVHLRHASSITWNFNAENKLRVSLGMATCQ